jgi:hypothetical protein
MTICSMMLAMWCFRPGSSPRMWSGRLFTSAPFEPHFTPGLFDGSDECLAWCPRCLMVEAVMFTKAALIWGTPFLPTSSCRHHPHCLSLWIPVRRLSSMPVETRAIRSGRLDGCHCTSRGRRLRWWRNLRLSSWCSACSQCWSHFRRLRHRW